jgi:hypothetical protein
LARLIDQAAATYSDREQIITELDLYGRLLPQLDLEEQIWSDLARGFGGRFEATPSGGRPALLRNLAISLAGADQATAQEIGPQVAGQVFEDPAAGLQLLEQLGEIPKALRNDFVARLTTLAAQPEHWQAASSALAEIGGADYPQWQVNSLHHLLREDHLAEAEAMLGAYRDLFAENQTRLRESIAPLLIDRAKADQRTPIAILEATVPALSKEELDQLASAYVERLLTPEGAAARDLLSEIGDTAAAPLGLRVAHLAVARLGDEQQPGPTFLLELAFARVGDLGPEDQRIFAAAMAARIRAQPSEAPNIAGSLARVSDLRAEPAKTLVDACLDIDRSLDGVEARRAILDAALALRGRDNSLATKAIRRHLKRLSESESGIDRDLAAEFLAKLDA